MSPNDYQEAAHRTALYQSESWRPLEYVALKLAGESGEVAEVRGKMLRDGNGMMTDAWRDRILRELGDVCWYSAEAATIHKVAFADVMKHALVFAGSRREEGMSLNDMALKLTIVTAIFSQEALTAIRFTKGLVANEHALVSQLGAVMAHVIVIAEVLGKTIEDVFRMNINKLADRKERNAIHGDGSDR